MVAPPGSLSLDEEIRSLRAQVEELGRRRNVFPVCRVRFSGSTGLGVGDTWAQAGWAAFEDPTGMYDHDGTYSRINFKAPGYYLVHYHSSLTGPTSGYAAARVTLNARDVAASIASDTRLFPPGASGDGAICDAFRSRIQFDAGDMLYWANFTSVAATLNGSALGTPTEIAVSYVNSVA